MIDASEMSGALAGVLGATRIEDLRVLTGGASRATWAFTADDRPLILRTGPPDEIHAGMELEAAALRRAADTGAPVPGIVTASNSVEALGNPYLVCDFIAGETIVRKIARTLDDTSRSALLTQCAQALAQIHRADPDGIGLAVSDPLQDWRRELDEMGDTTAPFEYAFRWLERHRPAPTAAVLAHGDFRMGNLIVADGQLAAVLDWELTHIGEAADDLAWFCIRAWRFGAPKELGAGGLGSIEDFVTAYETAGGAPINREALHWWLVLATLRWGVICRYQYERHRCGQTRSVELAAIGRRVCETEHDLLTLLEAP